MKKVFILLIFHAFFVGAEGQHYVLYGTTTLGGTSNNGTIFEYDPITNKEKIVYSFGKCSDPISQLYWASNKMLYGTAAFGGTYGPGTLFYYNPYTGNDSVLINFDSANGAYSESEPIEYPNGILYDLTNSGGTNKEGVLFRYSINTKKDTVLVDYGGSLGSGSDGNLVVDSARKVFYGYTAQGGPKNYGALFSFNPATGKDSVLFNFDSINGIKPIAQGFCLANNSMLYGMATYGGVDNVGVIFRYNPKTGQDTVIYNFDNTHGALPWANNLIQASNGLLYGMVSSGGMYGDGTLFSIDPNTNNYSLLANFDSNGSNASGYLVQDPDNGLIYGTTFGGGAHNKGMIFSYNIATGKDSVLYSFTGNPDGDSPAEGMTLVKDTLTGINELQASEVNVEIYPNPSNGVFNFQADSQWLIANSRIEVYNMLGQQIAKSPEYSGPLANSRMQIDLSNQPKGIYFYRISNLNGGLIAQGKLVIE
jgi:uncharacterized repeat protein (TIGR03803 family)